MTIKFSDRNILRGILSFLTIICMVGLSTAVSFAQGSYAIHSLATSRSYTATMQINDNAEDVWKSVVNVAKKRNPNNLNIKEENRANLKFEAVKMTKSGEELWASLKVMPESDISCQLIFTATMGGNKPLAKDMKAMVTDILLQFCDEEGMKCKIVK